MATTTSGLTRRRGAGGGAAAGGGSDGNGIGSRTNSASNIRDGGAPETSYESSANGHRIAFDPRDISESAERSKQPKLTLMEEVLLLGLKDKQVGLCSFFLFFSLFLLLCPVYFVSFSFFLLSRSGGGALDG